MDAFQVNVYIYIYICIYVYKLKNLTSLLKKADEVENSRESQSERGIFIQGI